MAARTGGWAHWTQVLVLVVSCGCAGRATGAQAPTPSRDRPQMQLQPLPPATASSFAKLALDCVHRPYPNKVGHVLRDDADARPPQELTPAFYGCFDWHSAVHGHWLLVRLLRTGIDRQTDAEIRAALDRSLTASNLAAEVAYVGRSDRSGFERPYGLAWLLQLAAELRAWDDPDARRWSGLLAPLEDLVATRLVQWIPRLGFPIRSGEHSQTAFAFGLMFDWASGRGDEDAVRVLNVAADRFYANDRNCPIGFEPSGHDFLSPCLAEADFMRRVLEPPAFSRWLSAALPTIPEDGSAWLTPPVPADRSDGKLAHLDGLNLSRAWMLEGIAEGLPPADSRRAALMASARVHADAGLAAVTGEHYAGGHWLGSFATYLLTRRGRPEAKAAP